MEWAIVVERMLRSTARALDVNAFGSNTSGVTDDEALEFAANMSVEITKLCLS
jgi:hypothetical protein